MTIMGMKITKTNDERIHLNQNQNFKNKIKNTISRIKNTKCAKPRFK